MCHSKSDERLRTLATPKNIFRALVELETGREMIGYTMEHTARDDKCYSLRFWIRKIRSSNK